MTDVIIVAVLLFAAACGIRSGVRHFKGEGGCCGGGSSVKIKKKHLKGATHKKVICIEGMSCNHCKNRVESRLNELAGVSCKVNLKKKIAVVSMNREVSEEELKRTVEHAGYHVTVIADKEG